MMRRPPAWVVVTAGVAIVAVVAVVALRPGGSPDDHAGVSRGARRGASSSTSPSTTDGSRPGLAQAARAPDRTGEYAVDETELTITDPALDDRAVDVAVWYPQA